MGTMTFHLLPPVAAAAPQLTEQQAQLAQLGTGVAVGLGGPGTGKTIVVAEAAAHRVMAGSSLDRLVVLAHSRAAAQTLRRQITHRLDRAQTAANVTTIHGLALGLLQRYWPHGESPWRLLRAPEQETRIRELLEGLPADFWPEEARAAAGTRAFARQLREVLARARQLSLDAESVEAMATEAGDPLFVAAARFIEEYLTIGDFSATLDYAEIVYRARLLLTEPDVAAGVRASFDAVIVDDAHESDHAQVGLLSDFARLGIPLLAVGDPHQRIGGYRGATATAMSDLAELPGATVVGLSHGFRAAAKPAAALASLASRLDARAAAPAVAPAGPGGGVSVRVYDDESAEIAHVAAQLRHAVTRDGLTWQDLVVIARSGRAQLSAIATELVRLGVPVDVSGDEIALSEQPAVAVLLLALRVAAAGGAPEADDARLLMSSPLSGLDGVAQRQLGRALLARHRALGTSAILLGRCLADPALLDGIDSPEAEAARALAALLGRAAALAADGAEVQQVLWELWDGTGWPATLREAALRGSRRANADLDAIVELFEQASRADELRGQAGVLTFLADVSAQEIPADTGRELQAEGRGVRVVTAHRTRGLEWERAWVVGVQEGRWPRITRAGILIDAERLGPDGIAPPGQESHLPAERRLFYVACARARSGLAVSAVQGVDGEGGRPSRFLAELGVEVERVSGRPSQLLSATSLVGELRRTVEDPESSPGLRRSAAVRLARLGGITTPDGARGFPGALPDTWWGVAPATDGARQPEGAVRITGSSLEALLECPRRWFLSRRASAESARRSRASVGDVVHVLARGAAEDGLTVDEMRERLDDVWEHIPFETEWLSATERTEIDQALERFARYHDSAPGELLAVERPFAVQLEVAGRKVELAGAVDRLERMPDGSLRVVDLKTGRSILKPADVADHAQLGVYQLATSLGAFDEVAPGERRVAPPALMFVRDGEALPTLVAQPSIDEQPALKDEELQVGPTWVHDQIAEAISVIDSGEYDAQECRSCRFCQFAASCPALQGGGRR